MENLALVRASTLDMENLSLKKHEQVQGLYMRALYAFCASNNASLPVSVEAASLRLVFMTILEWTVALT